MKGETEKRRCVKVNFVVEDTEEKVERNIDCRWWDKDVSLEMIADEVEAAITGIE